MHASSVQLRSLIVVWAFCIVVVVVVVTIDFWQHAASLFFTQNFNPMNHSHTHPHSLDPTNLAHKSGIDINSLIRRFRACTVIAVFCCSLAQLWTMPCAYNLKHDSPKFSIWNNTFRFSRIYRGHLVMFERVAFQGRRHLR